jgi:glycosyltransferase involved in cell wall biosynthesis
VSLPQPLVSVVLLTHNRPEWLAQAVTSVIGGSFDDLEVVVSNNGDPDHTRQLQSTVSDARIRWIEQNRDLDMLDHLVAGLGLARGKYVAVLHDDDWWSPAFLGALVPPLERHRDAVLSFADHYVVNQLGEIEQTQSDTNTKRWGRAHLREGLHRPFFGVVAHQSVAITGCVFRRTAFPLWELRREVGSFSDIWMSYLLAKSGGAAYYSPRRLMYYRAHPASHSSAGLLSSHLSAIRCRRMMLEDPEMRAYESVIKAKLARDHVLAGAELLRGGDRADARSHLADALRLRPTMKALGGWTVSWVATPSRLARL